MTDIPRISETDPEKIPNGQWIDGFGREVWIKDGGWHRTDGPAVIKQNGAQAWCFEGKYHRIDGPAITWADGVMHWCIHDNRYYSFEAWLKANNEITDKQKFLLKLKYG